MYKRIMKGRVLNTKEQNSGYLIVHLSKNGKVRAFTIHRLVAKAFLDNPIQKNEVNHKDGDKKNNRVQNLEWVTQSENVKHSYKKIGHKTRGKSVLCIELAKIFSSIEEAARFSGVSRGAIQHAISGKSKTSGGYTWKGK